MLNINPFDFGPRTVLDRDPPQKDRPARRRKAVRADILTVSIDCPTCGAFSYDVEADWVGGRCFHSCRGTITIGPKVQKS